MWTLPPVLALLDVFLLAVCSSKRSKTNDVIPMSDYGLHDVHCIMPMSLIKPIKREPVPRPLHTCPDAAPWRVNESRHALPLRAPVGLHALALAGPLTSLQLTPTWSWSTAPVRCTGIATAPAATDMLPANWCGRKLSSPAGIGTQTWSLSTTPTKWSSSPPW